MRKFYSFVLILTAALCSFSNSACGEELTFADGSATSANVPLYGYYADMSGTTSQVLYLSSDVEDLANGTITSLKFYSSAASKSWTGTFSVKLAEVDVATLSGLLTPDFTEVYRGSLSITSNVMTIAFTNSFEYSGEHNLLLEISVATTGNCPEANFYGISRTGASYCNKVYTQSNVLPKTTFIYTPGAAPTCPKPTLSLDDKDDESATFSWTTGGSEAQWQYLCLPAATTLNDSHWASSTLTSSTSAIIDGLSSNTNYKFYLRAYCDASDQSKPVVNAFQTDCGIVSLPWNYGFETSEGATTGSLPMCWELDKANDSYDYAYANNSGAYAGSQCLYMRVYGSGGSKIVILPEFIQEVKDLKISFYYKNNNTGTTNYGQLEVGYVDPTNGNAFTSKNMLTQTTTYTSSGLIVMPGTAPVGSRIAFRLTGKKTYYTYAYIDNIHVESAQDCSKPATPIYSDLTGSSVTLSWTANKGVTDYKYINVDRTATPGYVLDWENDAIPVTGTSVDLSELVDGHNYEFYVMCACGTVASNACTYQPLSCPNVTGVTLSNKVYNGVTVNWTTSASTNCDVRYKAGSGAWNSAGTNISGSSKAITGLSVGTTYTFEVKPSCSADAWVAAGETYTPSCPIPGALTLSGQKYNGVTVSWSAITGISTYNLRYRKGSDSWTEVNDIAALTYTIASGLVTNQEYTIELYSECGGSPATTTYTPEYAAPTGVLVAAEDLGGDPSWSPVTGATGYQYIVVLKDAAQDWSSPATGTTVSSGYIHANPKLSGLHAKTDYDFYVRAVYPGGELSAATKKSFKTSSHAPNTPTITGITSSSAIATWTKPSACQSNRFQWACKASGTPTDGEYTLLADGVKTVTVTGLTSNTNYTFYVRTYYEEGIYSSAASTSFKTDCGTSEIGWVEHFNESVLSSCWSVSNGNSSYSAWEKYNYTDEGYSSSYSIRYKGRSGYAAATLQSPSLYLAEKAVLKLYWKNANGLTVDVKVSTDEGITKTSITHPLSGTQASMAQKTIDLSAYAEETVILYIIAQGNAGSTRYIYMDEVTLEYAPCGAPTELVAVPTTDGAMISWSHDEDGPFDLQYREYKSTAPYNEWISINGIAAKTRTLTGLTSGTKYDVRVRANCSAHRVSEWVATTFTPQCAAPSSIELTAVTNSSASLSWTSNAQSLRYKADGEDDWRTPVTPATATTHNLTGLSGNTTYHVQVQAECAPDASSNWSSTFDFTTKCDAITITKLELYEADFSGLSGVMPDCWEKSETTYPYVSSNALTFNGNTAGQIAILPNFTNAVDELTVKFSYSSTYAKIAVGYINTSDEFVAIETFNATNDGSVATSEVSVPLDGATSAKNIALAFADISSSYASGYVKNVSVELTPACRVPASLSSASSITTNGATFTWTASGFGESYWQYICVPTGETPDWSEATKVNVRTATLSGLDSETTYDFYVRSWCGEEEQSEALSATFTTLCGIKQLDYHIPTISAGNIPACWSSTRWSSSKGNWYTYDDGAGNYKLRYYAGSGSITAYIETPAIDLAYESVLKFSYSNNQSSRPVPSKVIISNGKTTKIIELPTTASGELVSTYVTNPIDLTNVGGTNFTGDTITIKFQGEASGADSYFRISNVSVETKAHIFTNANGNGQWATAGNWNKNAVPTINNDVVVTKPVLVSAETIAKAKSVVVDQTGTHTGAIDILPKGELIINGTLRKATGTAKAKIYSPTAENDVNIGSSAAGLGGLVIGSHAAANGLNDATVNFYSLSHGSSGSTASVSQYLGTPFSNLPKMLYQFYNSWVYKFTNTGTPNWERVNGDDGLEAFAGYAVISADPVGHTYWMQGTLVASENQNISLQFNSGDGSNPDNENMLANSWMAPIQIRAFNAATDFTNADATIYIFNSGSPDDYETNNGASTTGALAGQYSAYTPGTAAATDVIPAMQAFSVYTSATEASITLDYNSLVYVPAVAGLAITPNRAPRRTAADAYEEGEPVRMRLFVNAASSYGDMLYMLEREDFSEDFENGWDARKMFGESVAPQLYAITPDGNMAINCVPTFEGTILGFRKGANDNGYTFTFDYDGADSWYLLDLKEQVSTLITTNSSYMFVAAADDLAARFIISRTPLNYTDGVATGVDNHTTSAASQKLLIDGVLYIIRNGRIYSAEGALLK